MNYKDQIYTRTTVRLSFKDKLRVLFGRKLIVEVDIMTEYSVGKCLTTSKALVTRFRQPAKSPGGYSVCE